MFYLGYKQMASSFLFSFGVLAGLFKYVCVVFKVCMAWGIVYVQFSLLISIQELFALQLFLFVASCFVCHKEAQRTREQIHFQTKPVQQKLKYTYSTLKRWICANSYKMNGTVFPSYQVFIADFWGSKKHQRAGIEQRWEKSRLLVEGQSV